MKTTCGMLGNSRESSGSGLWSEAGQGADKGRGEEEPDREEEGSGLC